MDAPRFATPCEKVRNSEWIFSLARLRCLVFLVNSYPFEGVYVGGLVAAGEAALVAFSVGGDVLLVPLPELLDRGLNHLIPSITPHGFSAKHYIKRKE